jgi:hypothetical protein
VRSRLLIVLAFVLPAAAVVFPVLVLPAVFAVLVALLRETGHRRLLLGVVGGLLVTIAAIRFVFVWMLPNIVGSGQHIAEEQGLSHLREIRWAEVQARRLRAKDADGNGEFEYATLDELVEMQHDPPLRLQPPPLASSCLRKTEIGGAGAIYRCEGYLFALYLPRKGGGFTSLSSEIDPSASSRRFIGYAWPEVSHGTGGRAFFIDERDRICESHLGPRREISSPFPWNAGPLEGDSCGRGGDGTDWHAWRNRGVSPSKTPTR